MYSQEIFVNVGSKYRKGRIVFSPFEYLLYENCRLYVNFDLCLPLGRLGRVATYGMPALLGSFGTLCVVSLVFPMLILRNKIPKGPKI